MKIAVASQNRREVTGHAGRCRKFWIYDIEQGHIESRQLLELSKEQALHGYPPGAPHPLGNVQVLITGGHGHGLQERLAAMGVAGFVTSLHDPEQAVAAYLAGQLKAEPGDTHEHHHDHENSEAHECACGNQEPHSPVR